jgi:hypothetical protein
MAFNSVKRIADAVASSGDHHYANYFKPNIASPGTGGRIVDASMASGTPKYNAYVGTQLTATQLIGSGNNGIFTGPDTASGYSKHLLSWGMRLITPASTCHYVLADYLMFYPLVDLDSTDLQVMDNVTSLPRYTSGVNVQAFLVCSVQVTSNATATMIYVDDGDVTRTTTFRILTGTVGMVISGGGTASTIHFIPLASGSKGIKSVTSIALDTAVGGFGHLVLCRPLATNQNYEQLTHSEISFVSDKLTIPKIENGAFLNILAMTMATGTIALQGELLIINLLSQ